jgi:hypothetical protein
MCFILTVNRRLERKNEEWRYACFSSLAVWAKLSERKYLIPSISSFWSRFRKGWADKMITLNFRKTVNKGFDLLTNVIQSRIDWSEVRIESLDDNTGHLICISREKNIRKKPVAVWMHYVWRPLGISMDNTRKSPFVIQRGESFHAVLLFLNKNDPSIVIFTSEERTLLATSNS